MTLYTKDGATPSPLPFRIILSDGRTRTDPETFTASEIEDAGYTAAPEKPSYDPATQRLSWGGSAWSVEDIPQPAPEPVALDKLDAIGLFRTIVGMDDAGELAMRKDPALELLWLKWTTDVPQEINQTNPATTAFLDGVQAAGYMTAAQRAAFMDAWPTA